MATLTVAGCSNADGKEDPVSGLTKRLARQRKLARNDLSAAWCCGGGESTQRFDKVLRRHTAVVGKASACVPKCVRQR